MADTHSIEQNNVLIGDLPHHTCCFKEGLQTIRQIRLKSILHALYIVADDVSLQMPLNWRGPHKKCITKYSCERESHQGNISVSWTQHFEDHLILLEGSVTCIVIILYLQCAGVYVSSCAETKMLLLVHSGETKALSVSIQYTKVCPPGICSEQSYFCREQILIPQRQSWFSVGNKKTTANQCTNEVKKYY